MNELNYMGRINHQLGRRSISISISFLIIFALLVSPVSSLDDVIDDDCNIIQDVFDRDWKKYSHIDERIPLGEREWPAQQYGVTQSKIVDAEVQILLLKRDMKIDLLMRSELQEYKKALVHEQKVNLLKSFWRLSFYTANTMYKACGAGKSIGSSFVNLMTTTSSVSAAGSTLKILTDEYYQLNTNSLAFADNTQSTTEAAAWGTYGTSLSAFYEFLESLGDPKKIGVAVFSQMSREAKATLPSGELSNDEFEILRTQHLKNKEIDKTIHKRGEAILERKDKVRQLEAQIKELEKELAEWETKEKNRVKASFVDSCKKEKEKKCDSEHLYLCDNENDCEDAGGYWYNNNCNYESEEEDTFDGDTSDGEFNCPIPNEAYHFVGDYHEYWYTANGFGGPYYNWYDREKTKKHRFYCYNIEGERHGLAKMWNADGTLVYERNYKDGKLHGVSKRWYADGTPKGEWNYKDGKLHGVSKGWSANGKLIRECNYDEGKCVSCVHGHC